MKDYKLWDAKNKKIVLEQACHVWWDFIVEVYHLSLGGEDEHQGYIAAGGGWCYFTTYN